MTDAKPSLAPALLAHKHAQRLAGSAVIIRACAKAVLAQQDFDAETLKMAGDSELNKHLTTARKYASEWIDTHQKNILAAFTQIQTFDDTLGGYLEGLLKLADEGLTGANLSNFETGMSTLKDTITSAKTAAKSTLAEITNYKAELESDARDFAADVSTITAKLGTLEATKDKLLFNVDANLVASLDKKELPSALSKAFSDHEVELGGELIVSVYVQGHRWAINAVSYNESSYKNFQGYSSQEVFIVERSGTQLSVYSGKQGLLNQLQNRYEADERAMSKDLDMIAGGAVAAVVGVLVAAVGVLAEIPTAGASTALVAGGVGVAVVGASVAIDGGVDYSQKSADAGQTLLNINKDEYLLAVLPGVCKAVNKLAGSIDRAVTALGSMVAGWQEIENNLDMFSDQVKKVHAEDFWVSAELKSAKNSWGDLKDLATNILYNFRHLKDVQLPAGTKISELQSVAPSLVSKEDKAHYEADKPAAA